MKQTTQYNYAVIEDICEVNDAIVARMDHHSNWNCVCATGHYIIASECIRTFLPRLLFMDYSLFGGNAFMLLDEIIAMNDYFPYIVFFTAYMSDQPEIAEYLMNQYANRVHVFINKPIFSKLDNQLEQILHEAGRYTRQITDTFWIKTIDLRRICITIDNVCCISQALNPRNKVLHMEHGVSYEIKATWQQCEAFVQPCEMDFVYANTRYYLVNIKQIVQLQKPFIWLSDRSKIEVTKDRWSCFSKIWRPVSD